MKKLWGGRFKQSTDALMETFSASISFDKRLYDCDIEGSIAPVSYTHLTLPTNREV